MSVMATPSIRYQPGSVTTSCRMERYNTNAAMSGSSTPLAACAATIAGSGDHPASPNAQPVSSTEAHTPRKPHPVGSSSQPNSSWMPVAAASGAVIVDVRPAANRPRPKKSCAADPAAGSNSRAMVATPSTRAPMPNRVAPVARIANEMSPPTGRKRAIPVISRRHAASASSVSAQYCLATEACKKRL